MTTSRLTALVLALTLASCEPGGEQTKPRPDAMREAETENVSPRVSESVPLDERLFSFVVDPRQSIGDGLAAGDHVDVVGWFPSGPEGDDPVAVTLFQNAQVLLAETTEEGKSRVGLSLTAHEVRTLAVVHRGGELTFLARPAANSEVSTTRIQTLTEALAGNLQVKRDARAASPDSGNRGPRVPELLAGEERAIRIRHDFGASARGGDRVDLLVYTSAAEDLAATTVLQNVHVLAADQNFLTVAVTLPEVQLLVLARRTHDLIISLRNRADHGIEAGARSSLVEILEDRQGIPLEDSSRRPRRAGAQPGIEVIRGDTRNTAQKGKGGVDIFRGDAREPRTKQRVE